MSDARAPEDLIYPVGGAFMQYCYRNSTPEEFRALVKNQTVSAAKKIYGDERFEQIILSFDRLVGLR